MAQFYIGIDGGATKSLIRIEDVNGRLLGSQAGGPASIRLGVQETWQSIQNTLEILLHSLSLSLKNGDYFHVGMGLAGCEISAAYQAFIHHPHPFATLIVTSDSHAACFGAHVGEDGAIIIAGTGVVGFQTEKGKATQVSGWGFPHDDEGSGAWLGLQAVKITLQWLDKRRQISGVAKALYRHFAEDRDKLVAWANQANSTQFATLAPLVLHEAEAGDNEAVALLKAAACALDEVGLALYDAQTEKKEMLPCALLGSIAPFLKPYLSETLTTRLVSCKRDPEEGAILLLRHTLKQTEAAHG